MPSDAGLRLIDALRTLADELVARLDADACILSRILGDVLIIVAQSAIDADLVNLGQGFLVSDFPATKAVVENGVPVALTVADPDVDEAEAKLLRELGYASLLMLPFVVAGEPWGLIEVYRRDVRPFSVADADLARSVGRIG